MPVLLRPTPVPLPPILPRAQHPAHNRQIKPKRKTGWGPAGFPFGLYTHCLEGKAILVRGRELGDTPSPRQGLRPCTPLRDRGERGEIGGHPQTPVMGYRPCTPLLGIELGLGDTPRPLSGERLCTPLLLEYFL